MHLDKLILPGRKDKKMLKISITDDISGTIAEYEASSIAILLRRVMEYSSESPVVFDTIKNLVSFATTHALDEEYFPAFSEKENEFLRDSFLTFEEIWTIQGNRINDVQTILSSTEE